MREVSIGGARFPAIAVGCMGLNKLDGEGVRAFLSASLDAGLYFFDHADIYGGGECESLFGEAMARLGVARDAYVLQSKCGIVPGKMYDFSEEHILASVDGSLRRLRTDRLDFLLLHRPDALMRPEEVAAAFDKLAASGKVLRFGVSNMHPYQIELLQSCVRRPLCVNQLQFSPAHAGMITAGLEANMRTEGAALARRLRPRLLPPARHRDPGVVAAALRSAGRGVSGRSAVCLPERVPRAHRGGARRRQVGDRRRVDPAPSRRDAGRHGDFQRPPPAGNGGGRADRALPRRVVRDLSFGGESSSLTEFCRQNRKF